MREGSALPAGLEVNSSSDFPPAEARLTARASANGTSVATQLSERSSPSCITGGAAFVMLQLRHYGKQAKEEAY